VEQAHFYAKLLSFTEAPCRRLSHCQWQKKDMMYLKQLSESINLRLEIRMILEVD